MRALPLPRAVRMRNGSGVRKRSCQRSSAQCEPFVKKGAALSSTHPCELELLSGGSMNAQLSPDPSSVTAAFLASTHKLFINGEWVAAQAGKTFDVINPATAQLIAKVA